MENKIIKKMVLTPESMKLKQGPKGFSTLGDLAGVKSSNGKLQLYYSDITSTLYLQFDNMFIKIYDCVEDVQTDIKYLTAIGFNLQYKPVKAHKNMCDAYDCYIDNIKLIHTKMLESAIGFNEGVLNYSIVYSSEDKRYKLRASKYNCVIGPLHFSKEDAEMFVQKLNKNIYITTGGEYGAK